MLLNPFQNYTEIVAGFGDSYYEYDKILREKQVSYVTGNISLANLWFAEQIHGDGIAALSTHFTATRAEEFLHIVPEVDALLMANPGQFLAVKYADCIPILIYDKANRAFAAVHSGRRGTEQNIAGKTICRMQEIYQSNPSDLYIALGPAICVDHYVVSDDIFEEFVASTGVEQRYPTLDLRKVVREQLKSHGISKNQLVDHPVCTYEDNNYYSYRRDKTNKRQIAFIGMGNG